MRRMLRDLFSIDHRWLKGPHGAVVFVDVERSTNVVYFPDWRTKELHSPTAPRSVLKVNFWTRLLLERFEQPFAQKKSPRISAIDVWDDSPADGQSGEHEFFKYERTKGHEVPWV